MSFTHITDPEVITTIITGIVTLIAAIGYTIQRYKKTKKIDFEGWQSILTKIQVMFTYIRNNTNKKEEKTLKKKK